MQNILISGSAGLIGSEATRIFAAKGFNIFGIDNNMRKYFFGNDADTVWNRQILENNYKNYKHFEIDIRDFENLKKIFAKNKFDLILHVAAQPSHDWAAKEPFTDFTVNANGTLNMLECFRQFSPEAVFIFTSTNKVYGDTPNFLPLIELETRFEIENTHKYSDGIDETMSIDNTKHSIFGASKVAADVMVQEYGKYFGLKTGIFRGGCLTGGHHSGTKLHGFLSYLMRCCITGNKYYIYGYKGKQVRDNIHSSDLVSAFEFFYNNPKCGEVYNIGGGRKSNVSVLEAITLCEKISGKKMNYQYVEENRIGDHIWWISNISKFKNDYPKWDITIGIEDILLDIYNTQKDVVMK